MAFMALFGWIFIPIIILALFFSAITSALLWMTAHSLLVNLIAALLAAGNLLAALCLLRLRKRWKREGRKGPWLLLLAALWEFGAAVFFALYLIIQPLRFLPENFGVPFTVEDACYGEWEVTAFRYRTPGCVQTEEEIAAWIGVRLTYGPERFTAAGETYLLDEDEPYTVHTVRREGRVRIPETLGQASFEALGIEGRRIRSVTAQTRESTEGRRPLGQDLFFLNDGTVLIYRKGAFFEIKRVE